MSRLRQGFSGTEPTSGSYDGWFDYVGGLHAEIFGAEWGYGGFGVRRTVVPVGQGNPPVVASGPGIPELVPETAPPPPPFVTDPIDRRDIPSDPQNLPDEIMPEGIIAVATSWFEYWNIINAGGIIGQPGSGPPVDVFVDDDTQGEDDVSWIDDTYEWVDENIFDGNLPGGVPPGGTPPGYNGGVVIDNGGGGGGGVPAGTPPVVYNGGACGPEDPMKGCVYKKVCGQWRWVKQKRRRRKSLVTKSDAQGLAILKGLVGVGKTMDTWIATHS